MKLIEFLEKYDIKESILEKCEACDKLECPECQREVFYAVRLNNPMGNCLCDKGEYQSIINNNAVLYVHNIVPGEVTGCFTLREAK